MTVDAPVLYVWAMTLAWGVLVAVLVGLVLAMAVAVLALGTLWRAVAVYFPKTRKLDGGR